MSYDTGTGWVQRWIANLLVKGSIPSRVSTHSKWTDKPKLKSFRPSQWRFWAGRRVALWVLGAPDGYHSFRAGLLYDIETTHYLSPAVRARLRMVEDMEKEVVKANADVRRYKAEAITARKALSIARRNATDS